MAKAHHIPDHARAALQHLSEKFKAKPAGGEVDLSWARRILDKHARREVVATATLQMACEALGVTFPPPRPRDPREGDLS